ncbi:MAG TPA: DNA polymerase/3'-5' exonuclease PolX [Lentisphaeria bacterium]|nr:DNA polymerase/3'-5' exonuclease PolX [Lentisphaeria bacterium]
MLLARKDVIDLLEEIAVWLEIKGENTFKIRAYTNGARTLQMLEGDVVELILSGDIGKVKGFGKALVEKLTEFATTGKLEYLETLRAEFPESLLEVMKIPNVGPKKVQRFYNELEITSVDELMAACEDGRIAAMSGMGAKTAEKIIDSVERMRTNAAFFLFPDARAAAEAVAEELRALGQVKRLEIAGSLRRYKTHTKDADIIASTDDPDAVMAHFVGLPIVDVVQEHGQTKSSILVKGGMQVDLRLVGDDIFPFALHHFTGSKDHNVAMRSRAIKMGMKVSEWGLFKTDGDEETLIPCTDEASLFEALGLHYIPPELREDLGEIEFAESEECPRLVTEDDYRGVLHCHTHASDGSESIEDLIAHAHGLGHRYLGITDHSKSSFQANGLDEERLLGQIGKIEAARKSLPKGFTLFSGVECDIRVDGELDYEDEILEQLDFVIVSVHSAFTQSREDMTKRVVKALEHPSACILAHPTGRVLLQRDAYAIDLHTVIDAAVANNVAIEFNCNPLRLDMDWTLWHKARDKGVVCSINPDAHRLSNFDFIELGIGFCRKGWLAPDDILNCWDAKKVEKFFKTRKQPPKPSAAK